MIEFTQIPTLVEWAKKHILLAIILIFSGIFLYGSYSFVGGYATRFGETFVGSYSYGKFRRSVAHYSLIDSLLRDCLVHFNAGRVGVARFHNSVHDLGNNSMYFVSFETVVAAPGVASDIDEVANLSASVFSPILPQLLDGKPVLLYTRDIQHSPMKELSLRRGIKVALFVPIHDLSDRVIGMLTVTWLSENDVPEGVAARETMIRVMMEASARIGGYFSATNWDTAHAR